MQQGQPSISARQLAILVIYFIMGDMQLFLPSLTAEFAEEAAWISGLIGLPIGLGMAWFIYSLSKYFPNMTLIEINNQAFGKLAGSLVSLLFLAMMFNTSITQIREIGDFVSTQILIETPIIMICLLMIFPLAIAIHGGIRAVGRVGETIFPLFVMVFVLLLLMLLPSLTATELLPIWGAGAAGIMKGSIFFVGFPFCELFAFLMIFPNVAQSKHRARDYMLGVLIGGLAIWIMVLLCLLVLGTYITQHSFYSPYIMSKTINIGNFVQRMEAIFAISFIITAYFRSLIYGYAFVLGVSRLFKLRDFRILTVPFAFMALGYSYMVTPGIVFLNTLAVPWVLWILTYSPGLLLLGWGFAKLRGKLPKKETAE